jgi:hypothetical protein
MFRATGAEHQRIGTIAGQHQHDITTRLAQRGTQVVLESAEVHGLHAYTS